MQGPAVRICELFDLLKVTSEESASQGSSAFERSPPGDDARIAFEDVDIYTPSNVLLVRDLSFELTSHHDSLLLTGHNGRTIAHALTGRGECCRMFLHAVPPHPSVPITIGLKQLTTTHRNPR